MKNKIFFLILISGIIFLFGCTKNKDDVNKNEENTQKYKMGFVVGSFEHVFYQLIAEGIEEKAAELGVDAIVVSGDLDANVTSNRIQDFVVQEVDAIALSANDPAGTKPAIEAANRDGIPMFTFDANLESDVIKTFVGTDNYRGGVLGGEELIRLTKEGDNVAIVGYPTVNSGLDRENGAREALEGSGRNLKFVGDYQGDSLKAQQLVEDWLIQDPNLAALFTVGDPAATGALAAIKATGANTKIIGFDGNPEALDAMKDTGGNGKFWVSEISQNPKLIGGRIVEQMVEYLDHGTVDAPAIFIDPFIITAETLK